MISFLQAIFASWQGLAALSAIFAALTAIFAKVGVSDIHPDLATLIRTFIILVLVAGIAGANGAWRPSSGIPARTWLFLVLSGAATGLSWLFYFRALKVGPASLVAPIDKLSVVFTAAFAMAFLGERLSAKAMLGIAFIAMGAVLTTMK